MKTSPLLLLCLLIVLLLQACTTTPAKLNYYDFGATPKPVDSAFGCQLPPINLAHIIALSELDSNLMLYRLLYANDQQTHVYASHRWSMTPSELLTERIKTQLANNGVVIIDSGINKDINKNTNIQLLIELDDFSHYFVSTEHSYARIKVRATLLRGHTFLAQTTLEQQTEANAATAPAGALAMRKATDELILDLSHWLCKQVQP